MISKKELNKIKRSLNKKLETIEKKLEKISNPKIGFNYKNRKV